MRVCAGSPLFANSLASSLNAASVQGLRCFANSSAISLNAASVQGLRCLQIVQQVV